MVRTRLLPHSLSGRLVITAVALVAVVAALTATFAVLAMRSTLTHQLDARVTDSWIRADGEWRHMVLGTQVTPLPGPDVDLEGGGDHDHDGREPGFSAGQGSGTVTAFYGSLGSGAGVLISKGGHTFVRPLEPAATSIVHGVPADGHVHAVSLSGLGSYRVKADTSPVGTVVAGLPTRDIDHVVSELVWLEAGLLLLGIAIAAGAGTVLVRRQLRPLRKVAATAHEVSELPLASGEIEMSTRVPDDLTDPRTEVGQVGSAMNTMLHHVEQALDARQRSELQVRQFVADASHELRTPLATIHGYAELSRRASPGDPAQLSQAMSKVESEATRMSSLVDDLLLLARLDAGRPLERREVDLTRLVLEAVSDAQVVAPDHHWRLDLPDEPVLTSGDEQRLHQAVTNLLNNARRHTPAGTTVTVSASGSAAEGGASRVEVHDDGPGMPADLVEHAFERFTRGDSSRTRASGGAGLGLSLVEAITAAHGGSVALRSTPGSTTFSLDLPGVPGSQAFDRRGTQPAKT